MYDANLQAAYFRLIEAELGRMLELSNMGDKERRLAQEYLDHNEFGLAFEIIKNASVAADHVTEFESQKTILSAFMK